MGKNCFTRCTSSIIGPPCDTPNFMILGLDGAGKTTLLYRLKLPSWGEEDIEKDMFKMRQKDAEPNNRDSGYHYEEFARPFSYGMWDVPGTDAMRHVWPAFYRSIKVHGIIFVVGVSEK